MPIYYWIAGNSISWLFFVPNWRFLSFLAVAQRLSNQWPYNISVILHHKQ